VHGDLWFGNVLAAGHVTGVVDWEAGAVRGDPVRDLARFVLAYALYLDRHTPPGRRVRGHPGLRAGHWGAGVAYAIDGTGWFPDLARGFLDQGLRRLGLPGALWRDVALAGLADVAATADHAAFALAHLRLLRHLLAAGPSRGGGR
jgi:aminoglycoside phosphotransferase (APT) family kinase protein